MALEDPRLKVPDLLVILYQQDDFTASPRLQDQIVRGALFRIRQRRKGWQNELEVSTLPQFGFEPNRSSALLYDGESRGQAKACSLADLLGREKWLEDVSLCLVTHADPCIANIQRDVLPACELVRERVGIADGHVCSLDGESAAPRHGVPGIQTEVHERAPNFSGIGSHSP